MSRVFSEADHQRVNQAVQLAESATSAEIVDFDNDGWEDIIVVGEWMPIKVFPELFLVAGR